MEHKEVVNIAIAFIPVTLLMIFITWKEYTGKSKKSKYDSTKNWKLKRKILRVCGNHVMSVRLKTPMLLDYKNCDLCKEGKAK